MSTLKNKIKSKTDNNKSPDKEASKNAALKKLKTKKIAGIFLVLLSIYLLFAFVSYFFSWASFDFEENMTNWTGKAGALVSGFLIKMGFGIAAFAIVPPLFNYGMYLFLGSAPFPAFRTFKLSLFVLVWLPVCLGFFLSEGHTATLNE